MNSGPEVRCALTQNSTSARSHAGVCGILEVTRLVELSFHPISQTEKTEATSGGVSACAPGPAVPTADITGPSQHNRGPEARCQSLSWQLTEETACDLGLWRIKCQRGRPHTARSPLHPPLCPTLGTHSRATTGLSTPLCNLEKGAPGLGQAAPRQNDRVPCPPDSLPGSPAQSRTSAAAEGRQPHALRDEWTLAF